MENYLIDRQILGQLADSLIAAKYPGGAPNANIKENIMSTLDNRISAAIFGGLTDAGLAEVDALLDNPATAPDQFGEFFAKQGINLEQTITETMNNYKTEFLGGYNAQ